MIINNLLLHCAQHNLQSDGLTKALLSLVELYTYFFELSITRLGKINVIYKVKAGMKNNI